MHGIAGQAGMALTAPLVLCDASAALAFAQKPGLGRTKHTGLTTLWIQQRVRAGDANLLNVGTKSNLVDCLAKDVPREVLERHVAAMGFQIRSTDGNQVTST